MYSRFSLFLGCVLCLCLSSNAFCNDILEDYTPPPMFEDAPISSKDVHIGTPPVPLDRPAQFKVSRNYALELRKRYDPPESHLRVQPMNAQDVMKSLE